MSTQAARVDILLQMQSDMRAIRDATGGIKNFKGEVANVNREAKNLSSVGTGLRDIARGAAGLFGVSFSASFIQQQVRATLQWAGALNDLANQAGMTTQAFQTLSVFALENGGVKMEQVAQSSDTLRRNLQTAASNGASPLNEALRNLGLTAAGLQALAPEIQFEVLGRAINEAADKQAAFNAAAELLGTKNAPKLMEALRKLGTEGFDAVSRSTEKLRISDEQLRVLDEAGDAWERIALQARIYAATKVVDVAENPLRNLMRVAPGAALIFGAARNMEENSRAEYGVGVLDQLSMGQSVDDLKVRHEYLVKAFGEQSALAQTALAELQAIERAQSTGRMIPPEVTAKILADAENRQKMADAEAAAKVAGLQAELDGVLKLTEAEMFRFGETEYRRKVEADARAKEKAERDAEAQAERDNRALLREEIALGEIALRDYGRALNVVEASPFLFNEQKRLARVAALQAENAQIQKQIQNLERLRGLPGIDEAQLTAQQRQLGDRATANMGTIAAEQPLSMGQSGIAGMVDYLNQIPTMAERARESVLGIAGALEQGIGQSLRGLITQTMTWGQALANIGAAVVNEIINAFVRMAAQWITQQIVMAVFGNAIRAAQLAALLPVTAATTAMWAPAATAASIATLGGAAVTGAAAAKIAIASSVMGFAEGGYTGAGGKYDVAGVVHRGEFVMPADVTSRLGPDALYNLMDAVRAPGTLNSARSASAVGMQPAAPAASGGGTVVNLVTFDNRQRAEEWARSAEGEAYFVDMLARNLHRVSANA